MLLFRVRRSSCWKKGTSAEPEVTSMASGFGNAMTMQTASDCGNVRRMQIASD
jgi:hypothetical protein